jgi:hypothetical protein
MHPLAFKLLAERFRMAFFSEHEHLKGLPLPRYLCLSCLWQLSGMMAQAAPGGHHL